MCMCVCACSDFIKGSATLLLFSVEGCKSIATHEWRSQFIICATSDSAFTQ